MRPILLNGHGRAMTLVKYNHDGDLLFTISKAKSADVYWSDSGERLGTYEGHNGTIWDLDVNTDSTLVCTGSGDSSAIIWNCQTGEPLMSLPHKGPVYALAFSEGGKMIFTLSKAIGGRGLWELRLYEIPATVRDLVPFEGDDTDPFEPVQIVAVPEAVCGVWMPLNRGIMIGTGAGNLMIFRIHEDRIVEGEGNIHVVEAHEGKINRIQFNQEKTLFITASKDTTAKLFDSKDLICRKIYSTPAPINHAAISPLFEHVMTGGGQDAKDVTTTAARQGKFMVRFFHMIYT